jgi:hypothetical protein
MCFIMDKCPVKCNYLLLNDFQVMQNLLGLQNPISVCTSQSVSVQSYNYELCLSSLIVLAELEIVIAF